MSSDNLLLGGFQDFLPARMLPRNALIASARGCFEKFGFLAQDTPCVERAELLLGKYGEGEKLIYSFRDHGNRHVSLRYDLTVPLSRIVKMYANEISFPYRRYQMGMVWRADRPGKGRYREFMQMDADIVDDDSALADIEILLLASYLMETLGARAIVRFNCRQILDALVETCGLDQDAGVSLMRIIDKFDKVGKFGVISELAAAGFTVEVIAKVGAYLEVGGANEDVLSSLATLLGGASIFQSGFESLSGIVGAIKQSSNQITNFRIDPSIARGLDYYTGVIFETTLVDNPDFGSVCSGGRYDRLIKHPDGRSLPSVGLSIGIDRLFSAMESVNKAPSIKTTTQVFVVNFDDSAIAGYLQLANELRRAGVAVEIFSRSAKVAKQLKIANSRHVPLVLLMGPDEMSQSRAILKDMRTGTQTIVNRSDIVSAVLQVLVTV
ncbi:MAG: histidine--tRNA ligase [bacterium]|nr:histidine--tRNA ligase [bacterium]